MLRIIRPFLVFGTGTGTGIRSDTGEMLPGANANFGRTSIVGIESRTWGQLALGREGFEPWRPGAGMARLRAASAGGH